MMEKAKTKRQGKDCTKKKKKKKKTKQKIKKDLKT